MSSTATTANQTTASIVEPRQARRLSPEFAELLHMLSSLDAKPATGAAKSNKD